MNVRALVSLLDLQVRHLISRPALACLALLSAAVVSAVYVGAMAMSSGIDNAVAAAGSAQIALILREGSPSEANSQIAGEALEALRSAPGIAKDEKGPRISPELYSVIELAWRNGRGAANVSLRGLEPNGLRLHQFHITEGRLFTPGRAELIVGRLAQASFGDLGIGKRVRINSTEWTVVGVFETAGTVEESEAWGDLKSLQNTLGQGNVVQSVRLALARGADSKSLNEWFRSDPRLTVAARSEREYYQRQSRGLSRLVDALGLPVAFMLGLGAIAGSLNSMEAAVSARRRIYATLNSFGYGRGLIASATMLEALLLSLAGAVLGFVVTWLALDGAGSALLSNQTSSQVLFELDVHRGLLMQSLVLALIIGTLGGLAPAVRSGRIALHRVLAETQAAE